MKTKNFVMIGLLAMSLFVLTGCYTQMAKPDPNEDEAVAAQAEQAESEEPVQEEQAQEEAYAVPHETNVYVYGGYGYPYYYDPYWYDPFWSPYYPYRSGLYVHIGYGGYYRDPWDWCGSPWYYGWRCGYYGYSSSWWPTYGYYSPHYYGHYYDDDLRYPVKQRGFDRRGRSGDDRPMVVGSGTNNSRPSLSKTRPVVYTENGTGTLVRRTRRGSSSDSDNPTVGRDAAAPVKPSVDTGRRVSKGTEADRDGSSGKAVTKPAPSGTSGSSGNTGKSGSSSGTRVRKQSPPPSSGGGSYTPPPKRSSGGGSSVSKPSSGSSGNSGAGTQSSGSSGSSGGSRRTKKQ